MLEVGDATYTRRYGAESVERSEILHLSDSENATIVGDLASSGTLPAEAFDCVICTQTLQFIFDLNAAIDSLAAALRPGGVLLATVPGISQVSRYDMERWGDYWRFTNLAIERLFESQFRASDLEIRSHGNVLTALGFLQGLAVSELPPGSFLVEDPDYQVVVTVRAVRA
ncbi:MAG TPA: methyltransferase domain-containing protein [Gaiellaceae bacterium]|nr:methyltransferase domain-containing protein [Gaiellaceae bacterium]